MHHDIESISSFYRFYLHRVLKPQLAILALFPEFADIEYICMINI